MTEILQVLNLLFFGGLAIGLEILLGFQVDEMKSGDTCDKWLATFLLSAAVLLTLFTIAFSMNLIIT